MMLLANLRVLLDALLSLSRVRRCAVAAVQTGLFLAWLGVGYVYTGCCLEPENARLLLVGGNKFLPEEEGCGFFG